MNGKRANAGVWLARIAVVVVIVGGMIMYLICRFQRLVNGACPRCSDGWKVLYGTTPVEGGVIQTWTCSNDGGTDEDPGCTWYEPRYISDADRLLEAELMARECERIALAQMGMI